MTASLLCSTKVKYISTECDASPPNNNANVNTVTCAQHRLMIQKQKYLNKAAVEENTAPNRFGGE